MTKYPTDHTWLIPYGGSRRGQLDLRAAIVSCGPPTTENRIIVIDASGRNEVENIDGVTVLQNNGPVHSCAHALNYGLPYVETTWVWRMDADDTVFTGHNREESCSQADPTVVLLAGEMLTNYGKHLSIRWNSDNIRQLLVLHRNPIYHPATCIKTSALNAVGGWPEDCSYCEDYGLWCCLVDLGLFTPVRSIWTNYTQGPPTYRQKMIDEIAGRRGW